MKRDEALPNTVVKIHRLPGKQYMQKDCDVGKFMFVTKVPMDMTESMGMLPLQIGEEITLLSEPIKQISYHAIKVRLGANYGHSEGYLMWNDVRVNATVV